VKIKIFWQENCPNCTKAKDLGKILAEELEVQYYNVNTVDGLSEACLYQVMSTPTIILVSENKEEIESWRGMVPEIDYIREKVTSK
jgi:thioredoxin-related protein